MNIRGCIKLIRELELMDVSGGFECQLFNYGSMRDTIGWFNYRFVPGIYVLKGEVGVGGWKKCIGDKRNV